MKKKNAGRLLPVFIILLLFGAGIYAVSNRLNLQKNFSNSAIRGQGSFSSEVGKYPKAADATVVSLKDGDTYALTAGIVKKTIGGQEMKMLAYNGSVPGPLIKVPQGAKITLTLANNADVDTTLHSHGVRTDNKFDGVPVLTQDAIMPGNSFTYTLTFPDPGLYWYHPHVREDYAQELGLYGNFLVVPKEESFWNPVNRELILFVDDVLLENGRIAPFNKAVSTHTLMGRFGNTMLINGQTGYTQDIEAGEVVRLYVTNAANTRLFNLSVSGAKMKRVGADNGKYETESFVESILLAPSERVIVEVMFENPGAYTMQHKTPANSYDLASFTVSDKRVSRSYAAEFAVLRTNHHISADIEKYQQYFNRAPDKTLTLGIATNTMGGMNTGANQHMMHDGTMMQDEAMGTKTREKIEWEDAMGMMNAIATSETVKWKFIDTQTKKENMDINWQVAKGDVMKLAIINDPNSMHPMQHPVHIHGQRFLVLKTNGVQDNNLVWKDTALIQTGDTVELLVPMDNPGKWMIHCHIPEHMESGMMSAFTVI